MITLITNGGGTAVSTEVELKGGFRYTLGYSSLSSSDPGGSVYGANTGTLVPGVNWREALQRVITPAVAASAAATLTGTDNNLSFTAETPGIAGNSILVQAINSGVPGQVLAFEVTGNKVVGKLGLSAGTKQI